MGKTFPQDSYDGPWKAILDEYLPEFLELCFPLVAAMIDWSQPLITLEQELQQIAPKGFGGSQYVDKLIRITFLDGTQSIILIHIEVQNQFDPKFEERLFCYHVRIFDLYREHVISLAVLGDNRRTWKPQHFGYSHCGCSISLDFPCIKLIDMDRTELLQKRTVIAAFILAHLDTLETRNNLPERRDRRIAHYRRLLDEGYAPGQIRALLRFFDWLMRLPPALTDEVYRAYRDIEEEHAVTYITTYEEYGWKRGLAEGLAAGKAEGLAAGKAEGLAAGKAEGLAAGKAEGLAAGKAEGLAAGQIDGMQKGIAVALLIRFSESGKTLAEELKQIKNLELLQNISTALINGASFDDIYTLMHNKLYNSSQTLDP